MAEVPAIVMADFREYRYTAQDGLSLYYREYGDPDAHGGAVLCLPGLTRNSKDFDSVARRLSTKRRILCPDYRGRGRSDYDPDPNHYIPATYLNDIRHLLAAAGAAPVVVIGTSLGGLLAMAMGAAMPTLLAGAVLNDIGPDVGDEGLGKILDYISSDRPHADWDSAVRDLRRIFPNLSLETDADWLDAAKGAWREGDDGRLHFDWDVRLVDTLHQGPPIPDLWPLFGSLGRVPTLAVRGALSDILSDATFSKMAETLPGLRQVTIPSAGHAPTLSEPVAATAIDAFLASVP